MKKRRVNICTLIMLCALMLIYFLPVGITTQQENYQFYTMSRVIMLPISLWVILIDRKISLTNLFLGIIIIFKAFWYEGEVAGMIYIFSVFICLDYLFKSNLIIDKKMLSKALNLFSWTFLFQIVVCTIISGKLYSLIGDKNYLGYFVFLLYVYHSYSNQKTKWIWLSIGLLTFSRNFYVAIIALFMVHFVIKIMKKEFSLAAITNLWIIGQLMIVPITKIFLKVFKYSNYVYVYRTGLNKVINFIDESNYLRFKVNEIAWSSIDLVTFFFGIRRGEFGGLSLYKGKLLYPHNTFLVLGVQFGYYTALLYMIQYVRVMKKFCRAKYLGIWVAMLLYQMFLGPSTFYGVELIILFTILTIIDSEENVR